MKIGDKVLVRVSDKLWPRDAMNKTVEGKVVYIHPEGRYYTAETPNGYRVSMPITKEMLENDSESAESVEIEES